jgi:hypothetical protein
MKKATAGYAEIYMIPGAGHAESVIVGPDAYKKHVRNFLEKVLQSIMKKV